MSNIVSNNITPRSGDTVTVNGSISVGGTVTYEDVANVDSVGLITARSGVRVTTGGLTVSAGGADIAGDVTIEDKIVHTGDTNTAIRFPAADTFTVETAGSEAFRVDSSQRLLSGTTTEGAVNADDLTVATSGDTGITIRSANDGYGNLFFSDGTSGAAEYAGYVQYNHNDNSLVLGADSSTRLSITSRGGVNFNNGELIERVNITAGKLSDNTNINLEDGMAHLFTTAETTTSTPNIRVSSSTSLNSVMAVGDVISVTIITTAAAAGYSAQLTIDGSAVTEKWNGGSAPSSGGASGNDFYTYSIIKTGDAAYTVLANVANFA